MVASEMLISRKFFKRNLDQLVDRVITFIAEWLAHTHSFNWSAFVGQASQMAQCRGHAPRAISA
jgi:hypothetical protein